MDNVVGKFKHNGYEVTIRDDGKEYFIVELLDLGTGASYLRFPPKTGDLPRFISAEIKLINKMRAFKVKA